MQAFSAWSPPAGTLGQILAEAHERIAELRRRAAPLADAAAATSPPASFAAALRRPDVALIAEVKRRSPSRGTINADLSAGEQASAYIAGGAAAVSVLTEPRHFGGSADDLTAVRRVASVPVLKKDFHVDSVQLVEARALGASAVLLIARALAPSALATLAADAASLGLDAVVEIRTEEELAVALSTSAPVIGVNNRDLETLVVDFAVTERLLPLIPGDRVAVAESGVSSRRDVERAASFGAAAVLVGSALSASSDPCAAVRALTGVPRAPRAA